MLKGRMKGKPTTRGKQHVTTDIMVKTQKVKRGWRRDKSANK